MIIIDNRQGSKELYPMLKSTPAELGCLEFADFSFLGRGFNDIPVSIGIERKKIGDFLGSMISGRLVDHQIKGMINSYDISYLIIEGYFIPHGQTTILQRNKYPLRQGSRTFLAKEVYGFIHTLQIRRGIKIWRTMSVRDTVLTIQILYNWWTKKALEDHVSYLAQHQEYADLVTKKLPLAHRVAAEIGGIGRKRAWDVYKVFPTIESMLKATKEEWQTVPGIGKTLANKIWEELHKQ